MSDPSHDPFSALVDALERIAFLERQVRQLQQMHESKLPEGVGYMWVQREKSSTKRAPEAS